MTVKKKQKKAEITWLDFGQDFKLRTSKSGKSINLYFEDGTAITLNSLKLLRQISIGLLVEAKKQREAA